MAVDTPKPRKKTRKRRRPPRDEHVRYLVAIERAHSSHDIFGLAQKLSLVIDEIVAG
jgi:hypothetical protein